MIAADAVDGLGNLLRRHGDAFADVIYLDPPFGTGDHQYRRLTLGVADHTLALAVAGYDDAQPLADWLEAMEAVLRLCHRALAGTGTLYLHIDWRRGPHLRLLLDEIFGDGALRNEVIWAYGLGGSSRDRFARKHDLLLVYGREPSQTFFRPVFEEATSSRLRGQPKLARDVWTSADADAATPIDRAWPDPIFEHTLSNRDAQRTGYPTQKPDALADRICAASLPDGGLLVEPMCGSASLGIAALRRGGRAILCDRSARALDVARGRVEALGLGWRVDTAAAGLVSGAAAVSGANHVANAAFQPQLGLDIDNGEIVLRSAAWHGLAPSWQQGLRARDAEQLGAMLEVDGHIALSAWGVAQLAADGGGLSLIAWRDRAHQQHRRSDDAQFHRLRCLDGHTPTHWVAVDLFGACYSGQYA
jgi:site-specific DNA-methyltransferase (adenine-specific)